MLGDWVKRYLDGFISHLSDISLLLKEIRQDAKVIREILERYDRENTSHQQKP